MSTWFPWCLHENFIGPLYITGNVTFSDPSNPSGTYFKNYFYAGAWQNLQGRGFAGFGAFQTADSRSGIYTTYGYDRSFPYTGMVTSANATQNNNYSDTIWSMTSTPANTELDSTPGSERYFPYLSSSTLNQYEVGGPKNAEFITRTVTDYQFDNYGNATSVSKTVTDEDTGSPYYGDSWSTTTTNTPDADSSTWCLGLLSESEVAYTASDGEPSVTRTKEFTPDLNACHYDTVVTQPGDPNYQVTEALGYDDFGNVDSDTVTGINMAARTTSIGWGTTGQLPVSVTDPSGATTTLAYDERFGLPDSLTDANNLTTTWQYGSFGRKTHENRPDGTYTQWTYNNCVNWGGCLLGANTLAVAHYVYNHDGSIESDGSTYFDELQRPIIVNQMLLSGGWDRREVRYDSLGRVVSQSFPCTWSAVTTTCPYWQTTSYDLLGRPTQIERPIDATNSTPQRTTFTYTGRTTVVTDPRGYSRTTVTDVNGWPRVITDAGGYAVTIGYDAAGSKKSVTDNASPSQSLWSGDYAYGIAPFLISSTDADLGAWSYTVDALGERTGWTDAKGQHFTETYDALSRPLTRSEPDLYSQWIWGTSASDHNVGQLVSVCTGTGTSPTACTASGYSESETYDSLARLATRAILIPNDATYSYTWGYDPNTGLLSSLTYPTDGYGYALKLSYGYQNGILASITDSSDSPSVTLWTADAENSRGQVTQATLGNGVIVNRAYDAVTGWIASLTAGKGGGAAVQNSAYLFNETGDLTQRQDNNQGLTENFYYDGDDRVTSGTLNQTQNLLMTYAENGNISTYSSNGSGTGTYDYGTAQSGCTYYGYGQPHAVRNINWGQNEVQSLCYDANGNNTVEMLNGDVNSTISWTSFNQPATIDNSNGTGTFYYDQNHQRWRLDLDTSEGQSSITYIGGLMEKLVSSNGTSFRDYVHAGGSEIVYLHGAGGGEPYYITTDNLGSATKITDPSGNLVASESFDAWGVPRGDQWSGSPNPSEQATAEAVTRRGFTFQEMLSQLSPALADFNGRLYAEGSFLSPDPTLQDPSNPQDYNRYSYVLNNPLTYTDPSGYETCVESSELPMPESYIVLGQGQTQTVTGGYYEFPAFCYGPPSDAYSSMPGSWGFWGAEPTPAGQGGGGGGGGGGGAAPAAPPVPSNPAKPPAPQKSTTATCPKGATCASQESECLDFSPSSAAQTGSDQVLYSDRWGNWAFASGGSRDWATNDPDAVGGLFWNGVIGSYRGAGVTSPIFSTPEEGWDAATKNWIAPDYQSGTILSGLLAWTKNLSLSASSPYVKTVLGATPGATANTSVSSLSPSQLSALQSGQKQAEGWSPGTVVCGSGAPANPGSEDARQIRPGQ